MTTENANNDPVLDALREILAADWSKVGPDLTTVRDSFLYVRLPACGWHVSMDVVDPHRALRLAWDGLDVVYMEGWTMEQAAVVDQIRDRLLLGSCERRPGSRWTRRASRSSTTGTSARRGW